MTRQEVLQRLDLEQSDAIFTPSWDEAAAARPDRLPFLAPEYVRWACEQTFLPPGMAEPVAQAAAHIAADEVLTAITWYAHWRAFGPLPQRTKPQGWPQFTASLGKEAGLLYTLVLLSGTPQMLELHHARRIPLQVTRDTMADLKLNLETEDHIIKYGQWGISPGIMGWLLNHWWGSLYRLGRLQFDMSTFRSPVYAFRRHSDGVVVALSAPRLTYRGDGQFSGSAGITDEAGSWTSEMFVRDDALMGNLIHPNGYAVRELVELPLEQWQPAMSPNSPCLDIHIPTGSPMAVSECGESLAQAREFFPRHFPERPFAAIACHSWILDNQFQDILPASSNLVRFQREVYLFPITRGGGAIRRVFGYGIDEQQGGVSDEDRARLPRDTGMQRAFAAHLDAGGRFRGGGCFLLPDSWEWGTETYRRRYPF